MPLKGRKACFTPQFLRKTSPITNGFELNQLQQQRKPTKIPARRRYDPIRRFRFLKYFPEPAAYKITLNKKLQKSEHIISHHKPKVKIPRLRRPKSAMDPTTRVRLRRAKVNAKKDLLMSPASKKKGKAKYTPLFFKFAPTVKKNGDNVSIKPKESKITKYQPVARVNFPEALMRRCRPKTAKATSKTAERQLQARERSKSDIGTGKKSTRCKVARTRKFRCKSAGRPRAATMKKTSESAVDRRYRMHRTLPDSNVSRKKPKKALHTPLWHQRYDWLKEAKRKIDDRQRKELLFQSLKAHKKKRSTVRTTKKSKPRKQRSEPWKYGDKLLTQLKPRTAYPVVTKGLSAFCEVRPTQKDSLYFTRLNPTVKKR